MSCQTAPQNPLIFVNSETTSHIDFPRNDEGDTVINKAATQRIAGSSSNGENGKTRRLSFTENWLAKERLEDRHHMRGIAVPIQLIDPSGSSSARQTPPGFLQRINRSRQDVMEKLRTMNSPRQSQVEDQVDDVSLRNTCDGLHTEIEVSVEVPKSKADENSFYSRGRKLTVAGGGSTSGSMRALSPAPPTAPVPSSAKSAFSSLSPLAGRFSRSPSPNSERGNFFSRSTLGGFPLPLTRNRTAFLSPLISLPPVDYSNTDEYIADSISALGSSHYPGRVQQLETAGSGLLRSSFSNDVTPQLASSPEDNDYDRDRGSESVPLSRNTQLSSFSLTVPNRPKHSRPSSPSSLSPSPSSPSPSRPQSQSQSLRVPASNTHPFSSSNLPAITTHSPASASALVSINGTATPPPRGVRSSGGRSSGGSSSGGNGSGGMKVENFSSMRRIVRRRDDSEVSVSNQTVLRPLLPAIEKRSPTPTSSLHEDLSVSSLFQYEAQSQAQSQYQSQTQVQDLNRGRNQSRGENLFHEIIASTTDTVLPSASNGDLPDESAMMMTEMAASDATSKTWTVDEARDMGTDDDSDVVGMKMDMKTGMKINGSVDTTPRVAYVRPSAMSSASASFSSSKDSKDEDVGEDEVRVPTAPTGSGSRKIAVRSRGLSRSPVTTPTPITTAAAGSETISMNMTPVTMTATSPMSRHQYHPFAQ